MTPAERRAGVITGLRALADLFEQNPHLDPGYSFSELLLPVAHNSDPRGDMAAWARAAKAAGLTVEKNYDTAWANVTVEVSGTVAVQVYAGRDQVCERIVVGTETVTREVPDPTALAAVPTTTVTETVEKVEWRCTPLLAPADEPEPAAVPA